MRTFTLTSVRTRIATLALGLSALAFMVGMGANKDGSFDTTNITDMLGIGKHVETALPAKDGKQAVSDTVSEGFACLDSCGQQYAVCLEKADELSCRAERTKCTGSCKIPVVDEGIYASSGVVPKDDLPVYDQDWCSLGVAPTVPNTTTYIILTRAMFVDALAPFVQAKTAAGERVHLVRVEDIDCTVKGVDVQEKIRLYLASVRKTLKISAKRDPYLLIVGATQRVEDWQDRETISQIGQTLGAPWEIPMRYVWPLSEDEQPIPTDQYYASVYNTWDSALPNQPYTWYRFDTGVNDWVLNFERWNQLLPFSYEYLVGRVPARTVSDVLAWQDKTLHRSVPTVFTESRFKSIACVAGVQATDVAWFASSTHNTLQHYCQSRTGGNIATIANQELPDLVSTYSHGEYRGVVFWPHDRGYELAADGPGFNKPPILFVHGCEVGAPDSPTASLVESYMNRPDGITAAIASTRSHWDSVFPIQESIFNDGYTGLGKAFFETKRRMKQERVLSRLLIDNLFMYNLYGDPSMEVVRPSVITKTSNPLLLIRGSSLTENVSINLTIQNTQTTALTGSLYLTGFVPRPFSVPANTTVRREFVTSVLPLYEQQLVRLGSEAYQSALRVMGWSAGVVAFTELPPVFQATPRPNRACDVERMSCVTPRVRLSLPVAFSCGDVRPEYGFVDGAWDRAGRSIKLKIQGQNPSYFAAGPVVFRWYTKPSGYYQSYNAFDALTWQEVGALSVDNPNVGATYTIHGAAGEMVDPYFGERPNTVYIGARFRLEAYDSDNKLIGQCYPVLESSEERFRY